MDGLTAYHAKYFAHELTKRSGSDSVEKFATALADAQVDLIGTGKADKTPERNNAFRQ